MANRIPAAFAAAWLLTAGCAGVLKQPPVARTYFAIDPGRPDRSQADGTATAAEATTRGAAGGVLRVRPLRVRPPYDGLTFVYRIGPSQFDTDYYNNFIAAPASLLSGALVQWLDRAGPLTAVDAASGVRSDLTLEGEITALYVDSTTRRAPTAVLAARFFLLRNRGGETELLTEKTYEGSAPAPQNSPAGFAAAWGQAYRQVLTRLSEDLRASLRSP